MRKHWARYAFVFLLAGLSGALLLHTSQSVQQAEDELRRLEKAAESEQESIRVLHAEWEYLNRPDRLESLAAHYLDLIPPRPGQMLSDPASLPEPFIPALPSVKPAYLAKPQPVSFTSRPEEAPQRRSVVIKPKSKPSPSRKSFNALLEQLQEGGQK